MKIAIITSGFLPIPATKGGAVETIIDNFMDKNEIYQQVDYHVYSIHDEEAIKEAQKYKKTKVHYKKVSFFVKIMDKLIYYIAKYILRKDKVMSYRYIMQRLSFLNQVSKDLKKQNYDKILVENNPTLFLALKWRKNSEKYKGKVYFHVHNEIKNTFGCEKQIKESRKIICVSQYIKNQVKESLKIKNEKQLEVLINCTNIEAFQLNLTQEEKNEIKQKYQIPLNKKILLYTGRLTKEKGIKELIMALKEVKSTNYQLVIVGSFFFNTQTKNTFQEELNNIIKDRKENITFTSYISHDKICKIYAIADIMILPSIIEDAAPLTIVESMASELPIITTNSGGIPEYAKDGCAIIVERNENLVKNLANNIDELLNNPEKRASMSEISKQNAQELNLDHFYHNLIDIFKK